MWWQVREAKQAGLGRGSCPAGCCTAGRAGPVRPPGTLPLGSERTPAAQVCLRLPAYIPQQRGACFVQLVRRRRLSLAPPCRRCWWRPCTAPWWPTAAPPRTCTASPTTACSPSASTSSSSAASELGTGHSCYDLPSTAPGLCPHPWGGGPRVNGCVIAGSMLASTVAAPGSSMRLLKADAH